MKILLIGAGNIGLVTALCFAEKGHQVFCVDIDQTKIGKLKSGVASIFEPELDFLLKSHLKLGNIQFSSQLESVLNQSEVIFLAIGTPNDSTGQVDLTAVDNAVADIARLCTTATNTSSAKVAKTIIIKSTAPPGTNKKFTEKYPNFKFISSPEFLREGSAIYDCLNPDRIIIGSHPEHANDDLKLFKSIYEQFEISENKFIQMDTVTSEMTKYAANIFLAARVSLMNEFSRVCERNGADIELLKKGLSLDHRIGNEFLNAGIGYGGSCFPKDLEAFNSYATGLNENLKITNAIRKTNDLQLANFGFKIVAYHKAANIQNPTICIWGATFKPDTDDLREAPALKLVALLLNRSFNLHIYDPKAEGALTDLFKDQPNVKIFKNSYEALDGTDALVIATEWNEFKSANPTEIKKHLKAPVIFDGRNIFSPPQMRELGFQYFSIGRQ